MEDPGSFSGESSPVLPVDPGLHRAGGMLRDEDRLLVIFAYLGPLCFVPLLTRRDPFVRWHARQGTALFLGAALLMAATSPFHWLFSLIPLVGRFLEASSFSWDWDTWRSSPWRLIGPFAARSIRNTPGSRIWPTRSER